MIFITVFIFCIIIVILIFSKNNTSGTTISKKIQKELLISNSKSISLTNDDLKNINPGLRPKLHGEE